MKETCPRLHEDSEWRNRDEFLMWEFSADGLMRRRYASINDVPVAAAERRIATGT